MDAATCSPGFTYSIVTHKCSAWSFSDQAMFLAMPMSDAADDGRLIYVMGDVPEFEPKLYAARPTTDGTELDYWTWFNPPSLDISGPALISIFGTSIIAVGGIDRNTGLVSNRVFSTIASGMMPLGWMERAPLNHGRHLAGLAFMGGQLYVFGGDADNFVGELSIEKATLDGSFEPNSWVEVGTMPSAHRFPTIVQRAGIIYLVGGEEMEFSENIIWSSRVSPGTFLNVWTPVASIPSVEARCVQRSADVLCISATHIFPVPAEVRHLTFDNDDNVTSRRLGDKNIAISDVAVNLHGNLITVTGGMFEDSANVSPFTSIADFDTVLRSVPEEP